MRQSFTPPDSVPFWDLERNDCQDRTRRPRRDRLTGCSYDVLLARPLLFIAMVFVAASVSLRFFRFGGVAKMVLGGVAAGFVLYVATELMEDLGASGLISSPSGSVVPGGRGKSARHIALLYQEDG